MLSKSQWLVVIVTMGLMVKDIALGAVVALCSLFLLFSRTHRSAMLRTPLFYAVMLMLPVLLIPSLLSGNTYGLAAGAMVWMVLVFGTYFSATVTRRFMSNIFDLLLVVSVLAAVYGIYCKLRGILEIGRVGSFFENPNHYAFAIELFILIALCQYTRKGSPIYLIIGAINLLMNLLCDCRTAWAALIVGITVFGLLHSRKVWLLGVGIAVGLVAAAIFPLIPGIGERMTAEALGHSLDNRIVYWGNAVKWISQRPMLGYGVCSYEMLSAQAGERVLAHSHNLLLNILLDTGAVGLAATTVTVWVWIRDVFRRGQHERYLSYRCLVAAELAVVAVHGLTDVPMLGVSTALIMVLTASAASCSRNDRLKSHGFSL